MPLTKVSSGVIAANAVVDSFGTQSITGDKLGLTAINANNIVGGAVTGDKLGATSINANNIVGGAVTGDKLGATSINANNIVNASITASQLATSLNLATNNVQVSSIQSATGTPAITFAANGQMTLANTPLQLTGGQIVFPATQIPSADANTLDDYEEGTYTMTWTPGSGSITLNGTNTRANYTKIGRLVTVSAYAQVTSVSSPTGNLLINLPFISSLVNRGAAGSACLSFNNLDTGGNISYVWSLVDNGDASITVYVGGGATVGPNFSTKIIATTDCRITFTYIVAN